MYFSAEHLTLANQAVRETFAQCSIAWQAIPHWDTGDPGQISVPNGILTAPNLITVTTMPKTFELTVVQAIAPTPDALLTGAITATKDLAQDVDDDVLPDLYKAASKVKIGTLTPPHLANALILARADVENAGYRAPSCLITNTEGLQKLSQLLSSGYSVLPQLLAAANANSLHRAQELNPPATATRMVLMGRRRRIPQGGAAEASPGEEPVDLAVSLLPSLEVDGETSTGTIQLTVRIRYATRVTDAAGLVALHP